MSVCFSPILSEWQMEVFINNAGCSDLCHFYALQNMKLEKFCNSHRSDAFFVVLPLSSPEGGPLLTFDPPGSHRSEKSEFQASWRYGVPQDPVGEQKHIFPAPFIGNNEDLREKWVISRGRVRALSIVRRCKVQKWFLSTFKVKIINSTLEVIIVLGIINALASSSCSHFTDGR